MAKRITVKEEKAIVKAIEEGKSLTQVAKDFKRSKGAVSKIAKENELTLERSQTKKAAEANHFYNKEKRMELLKIAFEKAKELIEESEVFTTNDMKNMSIALGTLIDKQRLEEGEPTDINQSDVKTTNAVNVKDLSKKDIETLAEEIRKERIEEHKR